MFSTYTLDQLFTALARKKVTLSEPMQQELLVLLSSNVAPNMLRSLQVVKIVEGFAKGNSSERVRRELEATIEWLKTSDDHYTKKFRAGALHRLEKALAVDGGAGAAGGPHSDAGGCRDDWRRAAVGSGMRLPGGFGRRAAPPAGATVIAMPTPAAAASPGEEAPLPPPRKPDASGRPVSLVDFYGDLADLRKCTAEHIAFLDEQIDSDVDDGGGVSPPRREQPDAGAPDRRAAGQRACAYRAGRSRMTASSTAS